MGGLVGYGAYIPYYRLERSRIAGVLGSGGGTRHPLGRLVRRGHHVDGGRGGPRRAGRPDCGAPAGSRAARACGSCSSPPPCPAYADKTNATAMHAALRLPADALAVDMAGAVRSGVGALVAAAQSPVPAMAVLADIRTGLPGSADERDGGDGAAAFVFGGNRRRPAGAGRDHRAGLRHRRVPRPVADARRRRLAGVGGTVRRAGVRPAGRGGDRRRPEAGRAHPRAGGSSHRGRAARPRGEPHRPGRGRAGRGGRRRPRRQHRQRRHRAGRHPAGRRPGPGRAGRDRAAGGAGRRRAPRWCCAPPRRWPATGSRSRSPRRSRRAAPRWTTPPSCPGAGSWTASRPAGRTRTRSRHRPRSAGRTGSSGSSRRSAPTAARAACRRTGSASSATRSTRWPPSRSPTCPRP